MKLALKKKKPAPIIRMLGLMESCTIVTVLLLTLYLTLVSRSLFASALVQGQGGLEDYNLENM